MCMTTDPLVALGTLAGTFFGGRLTDLITKRTLAGSAPLAEGLIMLPLFLWTPGLLITAALAFFANAVSAATRPVYMWLLTNVNPTIRGTLMGMTVISNQGGTILGSALGGLLLSFGHYSWLGWFGALTGVAAALIAILMSEPEIVEG